MNESKPTFETEQAVELDRLLTASLAARPEAAPIANLAARAMERAKLLDRLAAQQRRMLVVNRWRLRLVSAAAAILICSFIWIGGHRLLTEQSAMASTDDSTTANSTESYTPSTSTYVLWLGGVLFICTLAGLATENAIAPGRPSPVM